MGDFGLSRLRAWGRDFGRYVAGTVLVGVLAYFGMMAEELNNHHDGIWHLSNFIAGDFEISLGRAMERYTDRLRFGIVSSPLNILFCLLLLGVANSLIIRRFRLERTFYAWLVVFLFTVNPVMGDTFSYSYLAVNYLMACLFAVVAFYLLSETGSDGGRARVIRVCLAAVAVTLSMSHFQAYFSLLCTLLLCYGIRQLLMGTEWRILKKYYLDSLLGILLGGVCYLAFTKLMLLHADTVMADYKGASGINPLTILLALPASVVHCYQEAFAYVFRYHFWTDLEFARILALLLTAAFAVAVVASGIRLFRESRTHFAAYVCSVLLLPVAGNAVLLIAVGNVMTGLMAAGLLAIVILFPIMMPEKGIRGIPCRSICLAILVLFGWYALAAVTNDQLALREGRTATVTLAEQIVSKLYEGDYLTQERTVAFIGRPGNNPYFAHSYAFEHANEYAQFGYWSTDPRNNRVSWYGVLTGYVGVTLPLCDDETFDQLRQTSLVAEMPVFPADGSITVKDNVVLVKVSDLYE
ncbi:MAG: glucosyltransferase domain-containing protein [Lachnospiraceae bacterium]|nr:glucosyltransferase domain-containing protein [Lachnospiraceae bacterium]